MEGNNLASQKPPVLPGRLWIALIFLGFVGELAWAVENQYYNTFVYDNITRDPQPIAVMVALSAITATLTTILMGTLSDRTRTQWGRRRPYILVGYLIWGLMTAFFPLSALLRPATLAISMAILLDSLMTFFGATAHNAVLNAYATDITQASNRGKVVGVLELMKWVALLVVYGGAGFLIQFFDYAGFFYLIGGLVLFFGLLGGLMIKESPATARPDGSYWGQILDSFRWRNLVENRDFFLVLLAVALWTVGQQVFFPYLLIYLQNYIQLEIGLASVVMATAILVGGILLAYPFGLLVDRFGRRKVALWCVLPEVAGLLLFSFSRSPLLMCITGILWLAPFTAWTIATSTWSKDLYPEDKRGQFAGYYLVFWVMIPMVLGPQIGSWLVSTYGIPTMFNGIPGYIPTPIIFQGAALLTPLAALPLLLTKKTV